MKVTVFGITWAAAQIMYWVPALFLVIGIVFYAFQKRSKLITLLAGKKWVTRLFQNYHPRKEHIKTVLYCVAVLFIFVALLRPQWGDREKVVEQEGRELFIALDISRSMLASDIKPNRLAFAKAKIQRLLQMLPSERVGLLVFSGAAVVQCPLTRDKALFTMFLKSLDAQTISSGTTAIDQVISQVIGILAKTPTRKNKILVIFTDGEDFSRNLAQLKEQAQELGLHIFTYGVGTEQGAPIPVLNQDGAPIGYEKNAQGNVELSRLNPGILHSLALQTGGKYIAPTQSSDDLKQLVKEVEQYEKELFEDKELTMQEDRYPYFLAVSFVVLLVGWLL